MRYFEGVGCIMAGGDASYLLKFDFRAFLGDLTRDLACPYITITGKRDLLLYARYERKLPVHPFNELQDTTTVDLDDGVFAFLGKQEPDLLDTVLKHIFG